MLSYCERQSEVEASGATPSFVWTDCERVDYLEGQLHQVVALERSVSTGHGNDLGLLHQQVLGSVQSAPQQLEGPELLQMSG